ncbi:MAG: hypothetical protein NT080_07885 [Spirochaetes bacterium]|nr:hypothetical protein [Spirochaetota bacterium]
MKVNGHRLPFGRSRSLGTIARVLGLATGAVLVSVLLVWPIWYLATRHRGVYALVLALAALGLIVPPIVSRALRDPGFPGRLRVAGLRALKLAGAIAGIIGSVIVVRRSLLPGILVAAATAIGIVVMIRMPKNPRRNGR